MNECINNWIAILITVFCGILTGSIALLVLANLKIVKKTARDAAREEVKELKDIRETLPISYEIIILDLYQKRIRDLYRKSVFQPTFKTVDDVVRFIENPDKYMEEERKKREYSNPNPLF